MQSSPRAPRAAVRRPNYSPDRWWVLKKNGNTKSKSPTRGAVIAPVVIPPPEPGVGFWGRVDNWSERVVVRLEEMGAAPPLRAVLTVGTTLLPFLVGFSVVQEWITSKAVVALLAAAYLGLSFGATELQRHRNAGKQRRQASEFEEAMDGICGACGSLGGSIGSLTEALFTGDRQLDENECRYFCVGFLARIRAITREVLPDAKHVRLRATLAVPIFETGGNDPDYLRVWCYDETHGDRRWTKLPIAWPGAPAAYLTGQPTVIDDIRKLKYVPDAARRTFRSVISIPVVAGVTGRPLAVVNLDASQAGFFDLAYFAARVHPLVAPGVQTIGLAIQARDRGKPYVFGK